VTATVYPTRRSASSGGPRPTPRQCHRVSPPRSEGAVTVRALDEEIAAELAVEWITDNDPLYDDRIQPQAVIVSTEQLGQPDDEPGQMNNVPDGELLLEVAFAAALREASDRTDGGEATEADTELLIYASRPRPDGLSIPQSQAAALERWKHQIGRARTS
jgi:hypothetical protein